MRAECKQGRVIQSAKLLGKGGAEDVWGVGGDVVVLVKETRYKL